MRRILISSLVGVMLSATSAFAAEGDGQTLATAVAAVTSAVPSVDAAAITFAPRYQPARRPMVLPALYVGTAALQAYDAYSTMAVLKHGGIEANPVMKNVVKSPVAFVALKAGVAAASIMAAEKMWKNNNRVGAIVTMVATNGFMAYVAAHNAGVLNKVR